MATTIISYIAIFVLFILLGVCILNITTLLHRYRQTRIRATLFLVVAVFSAFVVTVIEIILAVNNLDNIAVNYIPEGPFDKPPIFNLMGILTAGMILLFIDYFENENISKSRLIIYISVLSGHIVYYAIFWGVDLSSITLDSTSGNFISIFNTLAQLVLVIFLIYVTVSCLSSIAKVKHFAYGVSHKKQLNLLSLGIVLLYFITTICNFFSLNFGLTGDSFILMSVIIPRLSLLTGIMILWQVYARSTQMILLQPQSMYTLIVQSQSGLPLYSFNFRTTNKDETDGTDSILISGGFIAIKSLLKEAIGSSSDITGIKFEEKEIMVKNFSKFGVFLIVNRTSTFLQKAMQSFGEEFAKKFQIDELDIINESMFQEADNFVQKIFGII